VEVLALRELTREAAGGWAGGGAILTFVAPLDAALVFAARKPPPHPRNSAIESAAF